jgi:hypothetical protein
MPDFTVIEGSGPPDRQTEYARQAFRKLVVEILRALARGEDGELRVIEALNDFVTNASQASTSAGVIVDDELVVLFDRALRQDLNGGFRDDGKAILTEGLRVIAESLADDPAAPGRASKRQSAFRQAIENCVLLSEERARANGWSYTQKITASLARWSPPPKPKAPAVRKPRKKKPRPM